MELREIYFLGKRKNIFLDKGKVCFFQRFSPIEEKIIFEKFCWALSCGIGGGAGADRCDADF